jgi:hypothetical protein
VDCVVATPYSGFMVCLVQRITQWLLVGTVSRVVCIGMPV